jgi:hypothetical protein
MSVSAEQLAAINATLDTLEAQLAGLIELSVDDRRKLVKMGDKSEAFCRQTLIVLAQNRQMIPPSLDLAQAENDMRTLDMLRPVFERLRRLLGRADDSEMALGSDIMTTALEGYALAKVFGKGSGLDVLREAMSARVSHKGKSKGKPAGGG